MIDNFKPVPDRPPAKLDTMRVYRPQPGSLQTPAAPTEDFSNLPSEKSDVAANTAPNTLGYGQPTSLKTDTTNFSSTTTFKPPDQIATETALDSGAETANLGTASTSGQTVTDKPSPAATITLFKRWIVPKKKFIIIASVVAVLLIAGGTAFALSGHKPEPKKAAVISKVKVVAPPVKQILSPLTGIPVTAEQQGRPVTGVMIENSPDARPQSGLKDAGVVYEAIAEAGITRFLALYQETAPGNVGPIRSSRPYYLDWAMAFDASYAHVGGSPDALQRIKDINVRDLDQFYNPTAYHRITTRYAPHNVYTGIDQLVNLAKSKGYDKSNFTSFIRKAEQPYKAPAAAPVTPAAPAKVTPAKPNATKPTTKSKPVEETRKAANTIDFNISGAYYNAHYDYDGASNSYKRSEGGEAHNDADSSTQLAPKVVVSLVMPYSLMDDGYHSQYNTTGTGAMYVFQDGTVVEGTWTKGEPKSQFVFKDAAGKPLALNAGQTWISVVADAGKVSYQ